MRRGTRRRGRTRRKVCVRATPPTPKAHARSSSASTVPPRDATDRYRRRCATADRINELAGTGFDLTRELPLRVGLYRLAGAESAGSTNGSHAAQQHVVVLVVHHISADGASMAPWPPTWWPRTGARYRARRPVDRRSPCSTPTSPCGSANCSAPARGRLASPHSRSQYWRENLADAPDALELPSDRPRPAVQSMRSDDVDFTVDAQTHRALIDFAAANNVSVFMVVHAALAVLLARLGGTGDVVDRHPDRGSRRSRPRRSRRHVREHPGPAHAGRSRQPASATARAVRSTDLDAFAHADVPFEQLVEALDPTRSTAHHPLFQVSLSLQNFIEPVLELPGLRFEVEDSTAAPRPSTSPSTCANGSAKQDPKASTAS